MAKKKKETGYAVCGQCAQAIDLEALGKAIQEDRPYVHYCGRVLNWGGNAEVLTSDLDDPDPSNTSTSSSPSAGDA